MDFYAHQDEARKKTRLLVVLFSVAVAILVAITNVMVAVTYLYVLRGGKVVAHHHSAQDLAVGLGWQTYLTVSAVVIIVILGAVVLKWLALSGGGKSVAESMGGRLVQPSATDGAERRLLNVVEEMAIASGMPVPPVYLLAHESGINAFAAGNTPADAVIGITRGAVESLNREQLQGVVAHEFSHIFNGDMRLNLRLVAVLHGILFIGLAGRSLLSDEHHAHRHNTYRHGGSKQYQLVLLGVGLVIVGWLGSVFGNWIKAAVSRQREFLADASAVQFTRNPDGLANALRIIGGSAARSRVAVRGAEQYSHMFFGDALLRSSALFATHPSLEERIKRVIPGWDGSYIYESAAFNAMSDRQPARESSEPDVLPDIEYTPGFVGAEAATDSAVANSSAAPLVQEPTLQPIPLQSISQEHHELPVAVARALLSAIPQHLHQQCCEPLGAVAVVSGLLLSSDPAIRERQLLYLDMCEMAGLDILTRQLADDIASLSPELRLPLLELSLPALKQMSASQYKRLRRVLLLLARADGKLELVEWCVLQVVCHYVEPALGVKKPSRPQYKKIDQVALALQQVLSTLAWHGHAGRARNVIEQAFRRGAIEVGLNNISLIDLQACRIDDFSKAVNQFSNCYPLLKPQLLKALAACAGHDDVIEPLEREIIHAIAAVMDCPLPVTLASAGQVNSNPAA